jgi:hypothetical protein
MAQSGHSLRCNAVVRGSNLLLCKITVESHFGYGQEFAKQQTSGWIIGNLGLQER